MSVTNTVILAGFGGQGVLFAGKILAYAGMLISKKVSWLPSYGPEMRGGTANVSVTISDEDVGSPLIINPQILVAMNQPSYEKFEPEIVKGGVLISDSTLISSKSDRDDINSYYIPATKLASDNNLKGLANIIMLGKLIKETELFDFETMKNAIKKNVPPKKEHLLEPNMKALKIGFEY